MDNVFKIDFRLIDEADLKETLEEVANLTTQNHVAILKTYGVDNNLDRCQFHHLQHDKCFKKARPFDK